MRRVIVESPYAGDVATHVDYALECMRDCLHRGEAPLPSHVLYAASGCLDDTDPDQRALGIRAGLEWGEVAMATVVYTDLGISPGMKRGIEGAYEDNRPVEYRTLPGWSP